MEKSKDIWGEIRCDHVSRSRAIRRHMAKRVEQWLGSRFGNGLPGEPWFRATLEREGGGHVVRCQLEIHAGPETWAGAQYGESLHEAISRCLAHMSRMALISQPQLMPLPA